MKLTTAFSLLALAYTTLVVAIPTPEASTTAPAKRGIIFGPLKAALGLEGEKRDVAEDLTLPNEEIEKRGLIFGPLKAALGLEGEKRAVAEHGDNNKNEDIEKRGLMFGPLKAALGLEGE